MSNFGIQIAKGKLSLALCICMGASLGIGQDSLKRRTPQGNPTGLVTRLDASLAFEKLETILFRLSG